jgi:hypothetical protein
MPTNDFLLWATGSNPNVLSQADYVARGDRASGAAAGKASAQQYNKTLRQTTIMTRMIAQFIQDVLNVDVLDNGTIATIETNFIAAIRASLVIPPTGVVPGTYYNANVTVLIDGRISSIASPGHGAQFIGAIGTTAFVVPANIHWLFVEVWGGGGGASGAGGSTPGSSGAAGGYAAGWIAVTPGQSINAVVGAGGGGTSSGAPAASGGTSSFSTLSATGGTGGSLGPGVGGVGSGGTLTIQGEPGVDLDGFTLSASGGSAPRGGMGGKINAGGISLAATAPGAGGGCAMGSTPTTVTQGQDGAAGGVYIAY